MVKPLVFTVFLVLATALVRGQGDCPPNIGYEFGNFTHWNCFAGNVNNVGQITLSPSGPVSGQHTVFQRSTSVSNDIYGNFPVVCPNGSGYSVQLGNGASGAGAERVSYTFNIPVSQGSYSIVYWYALVMQNPNHAPEQQPKFRVDVYNVTDNAYIDCASFEFISGPDLPGFKVSQRDGTVLYKEWAPVSINLSGYDGKTIRIEFTNNDCGLGAHFGYAYLDIDETCTDVVTGNVRCDDYSPLILKAPQGFRQYRWFDASFSQVLGTTPFLVLSPPPAANTVYGVEVRPYPSQGCQDTLYTIIIQKNKNFVLHVADTVYGCEEKGGNLTLPYVTAGTTPGLTLRYYQDSVGFQPIPNPASITTSGMYYVKAIDTNGCEEIQPVYVSLIGTGFTVSSPLVVQYPATANLTTAISGAPHLQYSYWKDAAANASPLSRPNAVVVPGTYYVRASDAQGCTTVKSIKVEIEGLPDAEVFAPGIFTPNGDGLNDRFRIMMKGVSEVRFLKIFNRWGQEIFETTDTDLGWNGTYRGSPAPVGTYVWRLEIEGTLSRKIFRFSGTIVLAR
ncbi:MAG: gliding motility-associated C-terminal domain-containing protein [Dinghuibacter sp.]|nr:gliding motility-associated C-terminal domain-containing protein [Dinghuibacter sp.]